MTFHRKPVREFQMQKYLWIFSLLWLFTQSVSAAGDIAAGKQLVHQGNNKGATACIACHGANGEGNAAAGYPSLAGLSMKYIAKQLHSYQQGTRQNPVMQPIAKALSNSDIQNVAAYFSGLTPATSGSASNLNTTGKHLAMSGDWDKTIPACFSCHGPGGRGVDPYFPALAGQHAGYIRSQLEAWRNGKRHNDENDLMKGVAKRLSKQQIQAVSEYLAALSPVKPESGGAQ
jgi:cytochrome c553